jgi:hypothetical protein
MSASNVSNERSDGLVDDEIKKAGFQEILYTLAPCMEYVCPNII